LIFFSHNFLLLEPCGFAGPLSAVGDEIFFLADTELPDPVRLRFFRSGFSETMTDYFAGR